MNKRRRCYYRVSGIAMILEEHECGDCGHIHNHEKERRVSVEIGAHAGDDRNKLEETAIAAILRQGLHDVIEIQWGCDPLIELLREESEAEYMSRLGAPQLFAV